MARTMDPSTNGLFAAQPFATPWTQEDAWQNVYSWINSQSNDSEGGDSVRSSTSSQPQTSPKGGHFDDFLDHPLLCDTPASPFDVFDASQRPSPLGFAANAYGNNNNALFSNQNVNFGASLGFTQLQSQSQSQATTTSTTSTATPKTPNQSPVQNQPQPQTAFGQFQSPFASNSSASSDYNLIHELLKLNLANSTSTPTTATATARNPPAAVASTSSPWALPTEVYRPAPVGARRDPLQPQVLQNQQQNQQWSRGAGAAAAAADFHPNQLATMQDLFQQIAAQSELAYLAPQRDMAAKLAMARRNNAAMQLHSRLEEVSEEYRQLEKERKQTEAELARHHLGKKISSSNGLPIPRLPTAPSRVDRLIVDFFREHARICTLLVKMEQLRDQQLPIAVHRTMEELMDAITVLQHHRNHERSAILQQLRGEPVRYDEEKEAAALLQSLQVVRRAATRARAANWCSLVWTLGAEDVVQQANYDRLVANDFTIAPPPIRPRPVKLVDGLAK